MRVHLLSRPSVVGGLAFAAALIAGAVLALNGTFQSNTASTGTAATTCDLYPLAVPASALAGRAVGDRVADLPHGPDSDRFTWLTWTSDPHEYTLARSLIPPGDSYLYTEPGQPSDRIVDAGDWVERVPDALNTPLIRSKLGEHVGSLMLVPVRGASRVRGARHDDQVDRFAVIRLVSFDLAAPARVSFDFMGYHDCRNTAPTATAQSLSGQEDTALPIRLSGSDAENDALTFEISTPPQYGTLSGQSPDLVYTPNRDRHGADAFTFRARDGSLFSEVARVDIAIAAVNDAPVLTSTAAAEGLEGERYVYQAAATDPDAGDALAFSLSNAPAGMTVDAATGLVEWVPTAAQVGAQTATLVVTDAAGASDAQTFGIAVQRRNHAPRIVTAPVLTGADGQSYVYALRAEDIDPGDTLSYALTTAPAGMTIDAGTGAIAWLPTEAQIGSHAVAIAVSDTAGASDTQSFIVIVVRSNRAPEIVSTPATQARVGQAYVYAAAAQDPDVGDTLTWSLVSAPAGMSIDPQTGLLAWTPAIGDIETHPVEVRVVDRDGADARQTFSIAVARSNARPSIVSVPVLEFIEGMRYGYPVVAEDPDAGDRPVFSLLQRPDGMSIDPDTGLIDWSGEGWFGNNRLPNAMCYANGGMQGGLPAAADILAVVDESGSMSEEQDWIGDLAAPLQGHLLSNDVGTGAAGNRFGLVGYDGGPREIPVGGAQMGDFRDFITASRTLYAGALATEDGWRAMHHAITRYPLRDGVARNLILVTDEDRDWTQYDVTYQSLLNELLARKVMVNAVVPVRFRCGDGTDALGMGQGGIGYKEDGRGGFTTCTGATATDYPGSTAVSDYVNLALATGGAGWDVFMISRGGATAQSFTNAVIRIKVQEIRGQIPDTGLADPYVDAIRASAGSVSVEVGNRGRAPLAAGGSVEILADAEVVSVQPLPAMAAGERRTLGLLWPPLVPIGFVDPSRISARIVPPAQTTECARDNNVLEAAWVRVRATDGGGLFDEQAFAVQPVDRNDAPTLAPIPDATVSAGRRYRHAAVVSDPDRGDAHRFALAGAPMGMRIDPLSGWIDWVPDSAQLGTHSVEVSATDLDGAVARRTLRVTVDAALPPPRFDSTPDRRAIQGTRYAYSAHAVAEPSAVLRFDVLAGPAGMTMDEASGALAWDVPPDHAGKIDHVVLRVRDQYGNYDLQIFSLLGDLPNQPPRVTSTPFLQATAGNNYGFTASAQDANVLESFRWRIDRGPAGMQIGTLNGSLQWPGALVSSSHPAAMSEVNPYCTIPAEGVTAFAPQRLWTANSVVFASQTLVGPLVDTDLDGALSSSDLIAVVAISWYDAQVRLPRIHAFDARNGRVLWSHGQRTPDWTVSPAMADLEGTGETTVLFVDSQRHLVALRPDGNLRWVSASPIAPVPPSQGAVTVADLDGDGRAEILVGPSVYSARGELKWQFGSINYGHQGLPAAIDLDGDGRREVLYRGEIRDAGGALRARTQSARETTINHAFFAPVRVGGSATPHVAVSESTFLGNRLSLIDARGNALWVKHDLPAAGPVIVADLDGDGSDDLYVPALNSLYSLQGDLLWTTTSGNGAAIALRSASVGDLDRDGELEILVFNRATTAMNLISGRTGAVVGSIRDLNVPAESVPPTLVDPEGDGDASLFVGHAGGLSAYRSAGTPWHGLARVLHQGPFALDQIGEDMRAKPVDPARPPAATNVLGARQSVASPTRYLADLRVSAPYGREQGSGFEVFVDVLNRGTGPSAATEVVLYRGTGSGIEIGRLPVAALAPGRSANLRLLTTRAAIGDEEVSAIVVPAAAAQECELGNNIATGRVMQITVSDYGALEGTQSWLVAVNARAAAPAFASVAPTQAVEGQRYRYQATATSPNIGDAVSFALTSAPDGARVDGRTGEVLWTPRWGQTGNFSFVLQAQSLNGASVQQVWTVQVAASQASNGLPVVVSTPLTAATVNQVYRYDVRATDPDGHAIVYSLATAPAGMTIDATTGRLLWQPSTAPSAPVEVVVVATDERQGRAEQRFSIQVYATPNRAPVITTRPAQAIELGTTWQYGVRATDADGDALSYVWNRLPAVAVATGADAAWTPDATQAGEHAVELEVRDTRGGVARQSFLLFVNDPARNAAPRITGTPNPRASVGSAYAYAVVAEDADGDALRYALARFPRGMTIDAASGAIAWTPANDQLGDHVVTVQVADGRGGAVWQTWTVRVEEYGSGINRAPRIASAPPATARVGRDYRYDMRASDPDGDLLAYSLIESPSGMRIDAQSGRIDWTPDAIGSHAVRVRVSDGLLWTEQSWILQVKDGVTLSASIDPTTALLAPNEQHLIRIVAIDAASQVNVALSLDGVLVPVEADLTAIVASATPGRHVLEAVVSDGYDIASAQAEFFVLEEGGTDAPLATITAPVEGGVVTAPTTVTGTVADSDLAGWKLYAVDRNGGAGRELASGTGAISGTLGSFDPTLLLNGQYSIVLQAWDTAGHQSKATVVVVVEGDMKLGHFSMSFEDVSVPVMGIPITITRTYDSRRSGSSLDFGHGWTVDYQNVRLHESRQLGLGWRVVEERSGFFSNWCVRPVGEPIVSVALPDGSVEKFRAKASPECQYLVPASEVQLVFEPLAGTYSQLAQTRYDALRVVGGELVDLNDEGAAVDPDQYRLTLKDGTVYDLDQQFGLRKVGDAHGNSLTFTREGVSHSTGVGVRFIRDAAGRIIRMELPDATAIEYAYDGQGDLVSMTDQVGQTVRFGYLPVTATQSRAHYLQDIIDPRGVRAARNEYDADGRLIAQIDADGQRIEYTLDTAARTQRVTNRVGETTVYVFDDRGRVLQETNALGETIRRTYDALGNTLTETNAEGETTRWVYDADGNKVRETDHLGNVTVWAYDSRGQVTSQTNANGDVTALNQYDARSGNLTATTDGNGARTDLVYGFGGNLLELRQPEDATTVYGYNSRGDKVYERGPDGVELSHLYDAAGRVLSESRTFTDGNGVRTTLTTRHAYDAKGRLIETIDPQGRIARTEYNAIDKAVAQIDSAGRRTEMVYDARGNLTETRYPDGSREITVYDAENRTIAKIDRVGRTTSFVHDAADRVVETHHADGAIERSRYDRAGREIARTDARGNTTSFVYDDAGRLLSTTNALYQTTSTTYRADGSKASIRDALGRTTKFVYDPAGRLIETIHPDNTPWDDSDAPRSRTSYDALGRKIATTDEAGRTTRYAYDAAGRLSAVIDALNQRTEYRYDGRGQKIAQIDALSRTTRWEHDTEGRPVARILPLGQRETMEYDALGRLSAKTDFNGQRTTYRYDDLDRVVEVRHADGTGVVTTYTASGQVATQTDAAGTTTYTYDARNRLLGVTHPDGVSIAYQYDAAGNRTRMTTAQQDAVYTYDVLNRLSTVVQGGRTTSYVYDAVGNRQRIHLPNGARTEYRYDVRNRLQQLTHYNASGGYLLHQVYTVDASGLRTQLVEEGTGSTRTIAYTYDALKRLTREQVTDATRGDRTSAWTYDAVGNRLTEARTKSGTTVTTAYTYDANDRLLSESASDGTSVAYQYDANGSLTGKQDASGTSVYNYDGDRRLVDAITPTAGMSYRYDANGIRQAQTVNGITTRFVVDPTAQYAQVIEERTASGNVLYLLGDDRIARTQGGTIHYLHADGLGSTRALSTSTGQAADRWWYEAFGEVESQAGNSGNAFLFAGEQLDPNLGHYYLRARYMDPSNGRFTQMDTFSGYDTDPVSLHKYLYANASPVNYRDPSGYSALLLENQMALSIDGIAGAINRTTVIEVGRGILTRLFLTVGAAGVASISGAQSASMSSVAADRARNKLKNKILSAAAALGTSASQILYHYTTDLNNVKSIVQDRAIIASGCFMHSDGCLRPDGAYATPIPPFAGGLTKKAFAKQLFDTPGKGWVEFFVAFVKEPGWIPVGGGVEFYRPALAGSYVPITPIFYGANMMP